MTKKLTHLYRAKKTNFVQLITNINWSGYSVLAFQGTL